MSEWGRVDDEGTVYVRTMVDGVAGERAVGQWKAGAPEQGLALFVRRFEQLATEVSLLEQRLKSGAGDPGQVASSAKRLKATLPEASAVGDLAALEARVDVLLAGTAEAVEKAKEVRAEARVAAVAAKTALAEEAEKLAGSSEWKTAGERLRSFGEEWKKVTGVDRKTDDELWQRVAAARKRFAERRSTHFGALEEQRTVSQGRKEKLIKEAEGLSTSTEWKATADRFKALMGDWKAAGRAPREVEDELWGRFKAAQDVFFQARSASFAEQDEEFRGNQAVKEAILAEAEQIDVAKGLDAAKKQLRALQDRWESAGKVPRDVMRSLEDRMAAVEEKVRGASDARFVRPVESPFAAKLREKVEELEVKLAKAVAAGRPTDELEQQLATQKEWLVQAGGSVTAAAPAPAQDAAPKKEKARTTAWVRAD
ncbi:MAG: DUF349 domain-containing protein [Mycobacteriales bacterium]|nr:DUF349 domain-containing protein [Mycobacteriales bacterium]